MFKLTRLDPAAGCKGYIPLEFCQFASHIIVGSFLAYKPETHPMVMKGCDMVIWYMKWLNEVPDDSLWSAFGTPKLVFQVAIIMILQYK